MSETKHTPGPWRRGDEGYSYEIYGADGHRVAMIRMAYRSSADADANADLVTAAPFMLEVLKAIRARNKGVSFGRTTDIARLAAKAIALAGSR